MPSHGTAADLLPARRTPSELARAASRCRACDLWRSGSQTVFGEGPARARVVLAGEQPGDREDRDGHPFVGPAGRVLDRALDEAGIDRSLVYVTNVVKHFKWRPAGRRRIHQKPGRTEIAACAPWFEAELDAVHPDVVVLLGATAAQAVFGPSFRIGSHRGEILPTDLGPPALVTVHPSSVMRAPDGDARRAALAGMVDDLRHAVPYVDGGEGDRADF